jgi:transcriptional regulator with AAA-type ATPase domain/tetratricopeptide (TPR) repeat protein
MKGLEDLLGESRAIQAVRENIRRLLARPHTGRRVPSILIQGETGTGKGLVARLIHRHGPRADGPFVDVNCAAIPETLLEAELFGFERGAFTDARRAKPGLFQTAHRGTIFLDEVGLLPEPLQAKLLKVLEEQAVRRLGSTTSEPLDVWIISATNTDLQAAIAERRFREDLYHRLAVLTLQLPPLREREHDVLLLADRFLARACGDYGLPRKTLSAEAQARLLAYPWPGNIRELGNVIERVALLAEDVVVGAEVLELPSEPVPQAASPRMAAPPASLEDAMRDHLLAALTQTSWNISRTAALLGISRNTLRARIEKFGLRTGTSPAAPARQSRPPAPAAKVAEPSPAASASVAPAPAAAAPSAIRWENRRVTLLGAILITPDADEELPDTSRALDVLLDKLRGFGGRIEELSPRGVGAVFGLEPVEDAPRRAAHAAMAIQKAAERGRRGEGEPFSVKIGIHVGQVLVGHSSAGLEIDAGAKRGQWAVLDALLASASPDSTVLSAAAAPFLERRFDLAAESGAAEHTYRLQGRERKGLALEGEMAWFVGRRQELDLLKSRLASARAGHGQIVGIVGEAGIGKSRLLHEFRQVLRGEAITYVEGHCLSYGSTIPYLPALEILRHGCRISDTDSPETVTHKLVMNLRHLAIEPEGALPYLLQFLGMKDRAETLASSTPEAVRTRTFQILRQMCINASRQRPLIIAVEDMHWIDAASEALGAMIESLEGVPLLLILTYRPGYGPPWLGKSHMTQIGLQPLSPEDSRSVLGGLLPPVQLSDPVAQLILSKAEGNPFFLEELARTVREQGELSPSLTVPDTVQEVLLARINRLAERERRLLQSAAVIGKSVPVDVLRVLAQLPEEELSEALGQLRAADFLYEASTGPDVQYTFKHALTHEVAYGTLRPDRRRELHARIVDAIERLYPDRSSEFSERLAHHALQSGVWGKAVMYLRQAGAKALARSANREAAACFEQALSALAHLPAARQTREQAIDIRFDLRNALTPLGEAQRTLDQLREAEALAEHLNDTRRLGRALSFATNCLYLLADYDGAIESGLRARRIADALDDFPLKTATDMYVGRAHQALGNYRQAIEVLGRIAASLTGELAREHLGLPILPAVFSRSHLAACLAEVGNFEEGLRRSDEAVSLAEATNHPDTLLWAYFGAGFLRLIKGDAREATDWLEQAFSVCRANDMPAYVPRISAALGLAYARSGDAVKALPMLERAAADAAGRKQSASYPQVVLLAGEVYLLGDRPGEAAAAATRALDLFRQQRERGHEASALRLLADIACQGAPADLKSAEALYRQALALAEELGMRPLEARCQLGLGSLNRRTGDAVKARECLAAATAAFREMAMEFWLSRARAELTSLR